MRRQLRYAVAMLSVLALAAVSSSVATAARGAPLIAPESVIAWRAFGYGPTNSGFNLNETSLTQATVRGLRYRFSIVSPAVRLPCSQQSSPVVAEGRLFLADQGGVAAYNASTGSLLWTYRYPSLGDVNTPVLAVADGRLFVAYGTCFSPGDPWGQVLAFNASTGGLVWQRTRTAFISVMVVDQGMVAVSGQDHADPFGEVTVYRATDGALQWTRKRVALVAPVSANGRLPLLLNPQDVPTNVGTELVRIATGALVWKRPEPWRVLAAGPAGNRLFAVGRAPGHTAGLLAVDAATGAVQWSAEWPSENGNQDLIAIDFRFAYVGRPGSVTAYNLETGTVRWQSTGTVRKPVVGFDLLYVVSENTIVVLNNASGQIVDNEGPYVGPADHPVILNGFLYMTNGRVLDAFGL